MPPSGPQGNVTVPNWHIAYLDHVSYKIRLQLDLWDTYWELFWIKSPCGAPGGGGGPDLTKIAHGQLDNGANNMGP